MSDLLPNGTAVLLLVPDPDNVGQFIPLEAQGDLSINESVNAIDTSSKESPARTVQGGRYESSGSVTLLYRPSAPAQAAIKAAFRNRTLVTMRASEEGVATEECSALLTSHNLEAPDQDRAETSIEFDVSGEWSPVSS
jgi:TP901-1 family phage major tail protein